MCQFGVVFRLSVDKYDRDRSTEQLDRLVLTRFEVVTMQIFPKKEIRFEHG